MLTGERSMTAPLMLSVSGARGIVGASMTPSVAAEFAAAFGSHVKAERGTAAPVFCLGRDSRPSGAMLAAAAGAGLTAIGAKVVDVGVVATPTVGIAMQRHDADGGIVITASHNPSPWNGLKCLGAGGVAPPAATADAIIARFRSGDLDFAEIMPPLERDEEADELHVQKVLDVVDVDAIRAAGFRVVLDSVNGAGGRSGRMLLERLGVEVVAMNDEPTGLFAHTPEPLPENLTDLAERTRQENATCGFAQDPDADRLAVIDEQGRYIGEEFTLVLAARRCLERADGPRVLAANLSTSRMIDDVVAAHPGARVERTAVGEGNVAAALRAAGSAALIGGEGNGGVIVPAVGWVRDSLSAMALILGLAATSGRTIGELVAEVPAYAMTKQRLDLADLGGRDAIARVLDAVRARFADARINDADGIRVDLEDAWVHVRPSNTEPILRIIAEGPTVEAAQALVGAVESLL